MQQQFKHICSATFKKINSYTATNQSLHLFISPSRLQVPGHPVQALLRDPRGGGCGEEGALGRGREDQEGSGDHQGEQGLQDVRKWGKYHTCRTLRCVKEWGKKSRRARTSRCKEMGEGNTTLVGL